MSSLLKLVLAQNKIERAASSGAKDSCLQDARLIPNIWLPCSSAHKEKKDQTDLLILTKSAAFVGEIKNWKSGIVASYKGQSPTIKLVRQIDEKIDRRPAKKPLDQVSLRVGDMEALNLYPQDRIIGLVIFVDPIFSQQQVKLISLRILRGQRASHKHLHKYTILKFS